MSLPYAFWRSLMGSRPLPFNQELEVSLNIPDGIPLKWSANGKLTPITAQADRPLYILSGAAQTSATGSLVNFGSNPQVFNQIGNGFNQQAGPGGNQVVTQGGGFAEVLPAQNGMAVWRTGFTPLIPTRVANASGSAVSIILPNAPRNIASGELVGGTLYCITTGQQHQIISNGVVTTGNPITIGIASPLGQPGATIIADGMSFQATPLGRGVQNIKFSALVSVAADGYVPSQLGVGSADWSGGFITVQEVDVQNGLVFVTFQ